MSFLLLDFGQYRVAWRAAIADPDRAFALLVVGMCLVYVECLWPGRVVPGAIGAVLAMLGLAGLTSLPVDWRGPALLLLSAVLFAAEARIPRTGIAGISGGIAMVSSALMWGAHWSTAVALGAPFSAVTVFLLRVAVRARRNKSL
jgi:membrane-bound serine protease (ClpP class)